MAVVPCSCGALCDDAGDGTLCDGEIIVAEKNADGVKHRCVNHCRKNGFQMNVRVAPEAMDLFAPVDESGDSHVYEVEKLVRHLIPTKAEARGEKVKYRYAEEIEMFNLLKAKLREEVDEFLESNSIEELADVFEVVGALQRRFCSKDFFDEMVSHKAAEKGTFERGAVMVVKRSVAF